MKQVASYLAMPIFLVDLVGTLIFYNEPAEALLGRRYDETGDMPLEEWGTVFVPTDADGIGAGPRRPAAGGRSRRTPPCTRPNFDHGDGRSAPSAGGDRVPARRSERAGARRRGAVLGGPHVIVGSGGLVARCPRPARRRNATAATRRASRCATTTRTRSSFSTPEPGSARSGRPCHRTSRRVDILLSHLHMDHIIGLGFFAGLFRPGLEVHIWGPSSTVLPLRARLTRYLSPPLFPVRLRDLPCRLTLHDVPLGTFEVPGMSVTAELVCHPGPTVGYRLDDGTSTLVYLSDHEPALGARRFPDLPRWTSGFDLAYGADVLIHDAQYADDEYQHHLGWGHSSISQAVAFAVQAGVRHLVGFHHDPWHDDDTLDALYIAYADRPMRVTPAREGAVLVSGMWGTRTRPSRLTMRGGWNGATRLPGTHASATTASAAVSGSRTVGWDSPPHRTRSHRHCPRRSRSSAAQASSNWPRHRATFCERRRTGR